jgi:hypothetical protein
MKKIAILQSNYIPWKGYFDMIATVDEFILYDDMQFTKNDWRNRNKIKTPNGIEWITVPVGQDIKRRIRDVLIPDERWQKKHWRTLEANYRRAPHFEEISGWLAPMYLEASYTNLSELNRDLITAVCKYLGITTNLSNSRDYQLIEGKTTRLLDLCKQAGATEYISGLAAKDYIEEDYFCESGIKLTWFDYANYSEYTQLWGKFPHGVTILDLLFNCGKDSPMFMKYVTKP